MQHRHVAGIAETTKNAAFVVGGVRQHTKRLIRMRCDNDMVKQLPSAESITDLNIPAQPTHRPYWCRKAYPCRQSRPSYAPHIRGCHL